MAGAFDPVGHAGIAFADHQADQPVGIDVGLIGGEAGLVVDVVQRQIPHAAELKALVGRVRLGDGDDHRLVVGEVVVPDRGELGGQPARGPARFGEGVDRQVQIEPLREREEGVQPRDQHLARDAVALGQQILGQSRRGVADAVDPLDAQGAGFLTRPVAVHFADHQHGGVGAELDVAGARGAGAEADLVGAVGGDVEGAVVEGGEAVGHVDRRVVAVEDLEAQVAGAAAFAGDDVFGVGAQVGVEVQRVRIVQTHLRVRAGGLHEEREVALVGPRHLERGADAAREVVVPLDQILLGPDVRGLGDDLLGGGDRVRERLGQQETLPGGPDMYRSGTFRYE